MGGVLNQNIGSISPLKECLHNHKLEYIEPDQVAQAVLCMQKLRRLSKGVHSVCTETTLP